MKAHTSFETVAARAAEREPQHHGHYADTGRPGPPARLLEALTRAAARMYHAHRNGDGLPWLELEQALAAARGVRIEALRAAHPIDAAAIEIAMHARLVAGLPAHASDGLDAEPAPDRRT